MRLDFTLYFWICKTQLRMISWRWGLPLSTSRDMKTQSLLTMMVMRTALAKLAILAMMHKGLGLRKVLKKVLKKALKKILLTQKRTQKSKCTFLSTQKSTQKFNFSECWVQKFTQKRSPKEILLKKVIYCPKLYSKKWTVFIPTYKYRWWHYPLVG